MCNYTMYQIVSVDLFGVVQISVGHNIDVETLIFLSFFSAQSNAIHLVAQFVLNFSSSKLTEEDNAY